MKVSAFGEIMLRFIPYFPNQQLNVSGQYLAKLGGSEINVLVALSSLGVKTDFITKLPDNKIGKQIISELRKYDVGTKNIAFGGDRIGIYFSELGISQMPSKVLYDRRYSSFSNSDYREYNWRHILSQTNWFHSTGITQAISQKSCKNLLYVIHKLNKNIIFSYDLNYRSSLWQWTQTKQEIKSYVSKVCQRADVIFANETDIQEIFLLKCDINNAAQYIFNFFPKVKIIAISHRESISASVNDWSGKLYVKEKSEIKVFNSIKYSITNIVDRIGSGDSFAAGIIFGLIKYKKDYQKVLDFAVTLSALKHSVMGDFISFSEDDVLDVLRNKGLGKVIR